MNGKYVASCFDLNMFNPAYCDSVEDVASGVDLILSRYWPKKMDDYFDDAAEKMLRPGSGDQTDSSILACAWYLVNACCRYYFRQLAPELLSELVSICKSDKEIDLATERVIKSWNDLRDGKTTVAHVGMDPFERRYLRSIGIDPDEEQARITKFDPAKYDLTILSKSIKGCKKVAMSFASEYMQVIEKKIFTVGVELNFLDFQEVFPKSAICHDPALIVKRLKNPNYEPTKEERFDYFARAGQIAFQNLATMGAMDLKARIVVPEDFVIANATQYNGLKAYFASVAEKYAQLAAEMESAQVSVGKELDGMKV